MIRCWLVLAALGGFFAVAAGAVAAHLAGGNARAAELLRTGALYGLAHAAALLAVAALAERAGRPGLALSIAGSAFAIGIILFSFSLYALAADGSSRFALLTPFGGVSLLIGWAAIALYAWQRR
jgi:uncharacterized membrane protein YgdD (TMEM256/DUF423 family)